MHETGLLRAAVATLCDAAGGPVTHVTLALGPGVDPEAADAAWAATAGGTAAAGAEVTWSRGQDRLECLSCGTSYEGDPLTRCPGCGGDGLIVEPAPEIVITDYRVSRHGPTGTAPDSAGPASPQP